MIFLYSKSADQVGCTSVSRVPPLFRFSPRYCEHLKNQYLQRAAADLSFSPDVRWQRGLPSMPFYQYSFKHIYDTDDIIPPLQARKAHTEKPGYARALHTPARLAGGATRFAKTQSPARSKKKLKKIRKPGGLDQNPSPPRPRYVRLKPDPLDLSPSPDASLEERETWLPPGEKEARGWEAIVLEKLDKRTARWIQSKRPLRPGQSPNKWQSFLRQQYDWSHIRDELTSESDLDLLKKLEAEEIAEFEGENVAPAHKEVKKPELLLPAFYR